jgi:S1-C subfamily serine protease
LLVGDIVTTWNGEPVKSVGDLVDRLGPTSVGQKISLGVKRGGNPNSIDVTLAERPRR